MTRLLVSWVLMLSLSSCANVGVERYVDQQPQLDLERFYIVLRTSGLPR